MSGKAVVPPEARAGRGWLDGLERWGNSLPDPALLFALLIGALVIVSAALAAAGWSTVHPSTGEVIAVESLLSPANLQRLFAGMPETLAAFPPLGLILVVMLGAAVAERSGLFATLVGDAVRHVPRRALTPAVFFIALLSHHAADAAYVVLIPLSAIVYAEAGRHPLAGIAAAYAGISGAFAGNLVPGQFDVLMLGITDAAAQMIAPGHVLNPLGNWWFTAALGLAALPIAWFLTDRIVEPRLAKWIPDGEAAELAEPVPVSGPAERRGMRRAGIAALAVIALFAALVLWPGDAPLVDENTAGAGRLVPFYQALVGGFAVLFLAAGWAYGSRAGTVGSHRDVVKMMNGGMRDIAPYLVIVFFAAHFIAMFGWSQIGPVLAIEGADTLRRLALPIPVILLVLLLMTAVFDLVIGSASAKWSVMAPIVVPMLLLLGVSPEMTTAAFRTGDSIFNIVTPVASNFVLVLIFCQRWVKGFGIGSLIAMMLPYSMAMAVLGFGLVAIWSGFGLPVGPGATAFVAVP